MLKVKRVYDPVEPSDGRRILVDRLWPRGLSKEAARIDEWLKEIGPSNELRKRFGHDPSKWEEFRGDYLRELAAPEKQKLLARIAQEAGSSEVAIVYGARDRQYNNAAVLSEVIRRLMKISSREVVR